MKAKEQAVSFAAEVEELREALELQKVEVQARRKSVAAAKEQASKFADEIEDLQTAQVAQRFDAHEALEEHAVQLERERQKVQAWEDAAARQEQEVRGSAARTKYVHSWALNAGLASFVRYSISEIR